MTNRLSESFLDGTHPLGKGLVHTDDQGRLVAKSGGSLTNLPVVEATITNNFDGFAVEKKNSNFTAEENKLYQITGSCTATFPINPSFTGAKIAFLIVKPGVSLTLAVNASSSGATGSRFTHRLVQYGNSISGSNSAYASGGSTLTVSGLGRNLVFFGKQAATGDFAYPVWAEMSSQNLISDRSASGNGPNKDIFGATFNNRIQLSTGATATLNGPEVLFFGAGSSDNLGFTNLWNKIGLVSANLQSTSSTTVNSTTPINSAMTGNRGFLQQYFYLFAGRSGGTARTFTHSFSITSPGGHPLGISQNILVRYDGLAETLPAGYGTAASTSYAIVRGGGGNMQFKIQDGSLTSSASLPVFDFYEAQTGVQRISKIIGVEAVYNTIADRLNLLYHYTK